MRALNLNGGLGTSESPHHFEQGVVRKCVRRSAAAPGHGLRSEQRVEYRLLGRLDCCVEERIQLLVRKDDRSASALGIAISDREREQQIAARVP